MPMIGQNKLTVQRFNFTNVVCYQSVNVCNPMLSLKQQKNRNTEECTKYMLSPFPNKDASNQP